MGDCKKISFILKNGRLSIYLLVYLFTYFLALLCFLTSTYLVAILILNQTHVQRTLNNSIGCVGYLFVSPGRQLPSVRLITQGLSQRRLQIELLLGGTRGLSHRLVGNVVKRLRCRRSVCTRGPGWRGGCYWRLGLRLVASHCLDVGLMGPGWLLGGSDGRSRAELEGLLAARGGRVRAAKVEVHFRGGDDVGNKLGNSRSSSLKTDMLNANKRNLPTSGSELFPSQNFLQFRKH